jgi:diacylglycerol kinase
MIKKHTISIKNAWNGIRWAFSTQPNYRVHIFFSALSLAGGWFFRISYPEFLTIAVLILVGFTIETINTAIEEASDAIDTKWREDIKITKDVSAGAMLLFALGSLCIAGIIFIPRIIEYISLL